MKPFSMEKPLIGMVHLPPTPLSPRNNGEFDVNMIIDRAVEDARILVENGVDGIMVENYGDAPFIPETIPTHTIACMALVVREVVKDIQVPVGVNILRNACEQAIGVAAMTGASFIRCNVHTGVMITNEGMLTGKSHDTVRYRDLLKNETGNDISIYADVMVKHAQSLVSMVQFEDIAIDTIDRGAVEAIIVSGKRTGLPLAESMVQRVESFKVQRPRTKVIIGSGVTPGNVVKLKRHFDGFIVGTHFYESNGKQNKKRIIPERVRELKNALRQEG